MTTTTIRLDHGIKEKAQKLAKTIGFSFSDLISVLLKKAVREGGIDLRNTVLTENNFTSEFEQSIIGAANEGDPKEFETLDDMIKYAKTNKI